MTAEADGARAVDAVQRTFGALRGLVNCAGVAVSVRVLGRDGVHDLDTFMRVLRIPPNDYRHRFAEHPMN